MDYFSEWFTLLTLALAELPLWYQYLLIVCFGLIVGSFLNVVIYRFHTGRSLSGRSHCLSCGTTLRWYELLPIVSYVALRARCRSCSSYIPARYALVEALTALVFLLVFIQTPSAALVLPLLAFFSILVVVAVYDLYHLIIPDELVVALSTVAFLMLSIMWGGLPPTDIVVNHSAGAAMAFLFYGGLWYVSGGRWIGLGDAKLAVPLGLLVGLTASVSMIVLSFWIGAAVSVFLLLIQKLLRGGQLGLRMWKGSITIKSEVPFAPFLIVAFILVFLFDVSAFDLISFVS